MDGHGFKLVPRPDPAPPGRLVTRHSRSWAPRRKRRRFRQSRRLRATPNRVRARGRTTTEATRSQTRSARSDRPSHSRQHYATRSHGVSIQVCQCYGMDRDHPSRESGFQVALDAEIVLGCGQWRSRRLELELESAPRPAALGALAAAACQGTGPQATRERPPACPRAAAGP